MRKLNTNWLYMVLIIGCYTFVLSHDVRHPNWRSHPCYAQAMIASDAVINARLGVPIEYVVKLAEEGQRADGAIIYSPDLLSMLLSAYLWEETPYQYSVKIFYQCAKQLHIAGSRWQSLVDDG